MVKRTLVFTLAVLIYQLGIGQPTFVDVTDSAGIDHQFQVFEGMFGGGACVFDLNNDGFEDIFITGGMNEDVLYLNNGNGTFKNIYKGSGLEVTQHYVTQGVSGADVNRDGWVDLFVTTVTSKDSVLVIPREKNLLFLNTGSSTFSDATTEYGLDKFNSFSTGVSFGDVNADGYPDAYIGNYFLAYDGKLNVISDATIVGSNQTSKDYLLINDGGKRFYDGYSDFDLNHKGFGFGGVFTDFDNDQDQDLFVNNDFGYKAIPDFLFENQHPRESFKDITEETEMDLKINSMGTAVGDYNGDGYLDYYITNIRINWFMVSQGPNKPFKNLLREVGMANVPTVISWGANFADFDHDGDVDLFVSNGDLNPNCIPMGNFYFDNDNGQFRDISRTIGLKDYGVGRGSVTFDLENDGDLDILVVNQKPILDYPISSRTKLFRNDLNKGNWIKVALQGLDAESHGIGSRIEVVANGKKMIREIDGGGSSHISQNSTIAHFGLGESELVDSLIVKWTGGKKQTFSSVKANQLFVVVENESQQPVAFYIIGVVASMFIIGVIGFQFIRKSKSPNPSS